MKRKIDRTTAIQLVCGIAIIILFINIVVKMTMIASAAVASVQPNEVIRQKYGTYIDEIAEMEREENENSTVNFFGENRCY